MELKETFQKVKAASKTLGLLSDEQRNEILQAVADAIIAETPALLAANAEDLAKMDNEPTLRPIAAHRAATRGYRFGYETRKYPALTTRKSSQRQDARKWFAPAASCRSIRSYRYDLRGPS